MDITALIKEIRAKYERKDLPYFQVGDTIEVGFKIREGSKTRIQNFTGICIRKKKTPTGGTFTVRKISFGVGVERIFPLNSPFIDHIKVLKRGKVRRARLYYLRKLTGKKAKVKELMDWQLKKNKQSLETSEKIENTKEEETKE